MISGDNVACRKTLTSDTLLDAVRDREPADDDVADLPYAVTAVERLLLDSVRPGEVHVDDLRALALARGNDCGKRKRAHVIRADEV